MTNASSIQTPAANHGGAQPGAAANGARRSRRFNLPGQSDQFNPMFMDTLKRPEGRAPGTNGSCAFSLIEILVSVTLLSVIIIGLVIMFDQVRKAFTGSMTQVDVLESGRGAADIISREMEQITAYGETSNAINFMVFLPYINTANLPAVARGGNLLLQPLVNTNDLRTNILEMVMFLKRENLGFSCVGYRLDNYGAGIGSLYRYQMDNITNNVNRSTGGPVLSGYLTNGLNYQLGNFWNTNQTPPGYFPSSLSNSYTKLIDGVVHFRIRALDTNGVPYGFTNRNGINTNFFIPSGGSTNILYVNNPSLIVYTNNNTTALPFEYNYFFRSNALPAYVEVELGVLEDRVLKRYNSLTNSGTGPNTPAWSYLTDHAGQVHVFRQRIPIRNYNSAAFQ